MEKFTVVSPDGRKRRIVEVDQSTILGKGGEAIVHRDPNDPREGALKVYHEPTAARERKVQAFLRKAGRFPASVMAPRALLLGSRDSFAGFGMPQLSPGFVRMKELYNPKFCADHGINQQVVSDVCLEFGKNLSSIHSNDTVVGDLNDGGLAFHKVDHSIAWMDVDSWDIPGHPCTVGSEMYICPELYGVDLSKGKHFETWHDWYSWCVLVFRVLLRKHPFKSGIHHTYKSVIERARRGLTVLDKEVEFPPVGLPAEMLTDELAHALLQHLKRAERGPFKLDLLQAYREGLVGCRSCGVWYPSIRVQCPNCSEKTTMQTTVDLTKLLGVQIMEFIETHGRIVYVQLINQEVYCLAVENSKLVLYRKDGESAVNRNDLGLNFQPGMRFGIFRRTLVICSDGDEFSPTGDLFLFDLEPSGVKQVTSTTSGKLAGAGNGTVFTTSRRYLYRLAQNMIIREERFLADSLMPRPVAQVSEGQTWLTADPNPDANHEVLLGFSRDTRAFQWFFIRGDSEGRVYSRSNIAVAPLDLQESMVDFSVRFAGDFILLMRRTQKRGKDLVRLDRIETATAKILTSETLALKEHPQWESVHGKAVLNGIVLHATSDEGIVRELLSDHKVKPLGGMASKVTSDEALIPYGKGVLVVRSGRVDLIAPK